MISFFWAGEAIKVNPMTDENDIKKLGGEVLRL